MNQHETRKPAEEWAQAKQHTGKRAWMFAAARAAEGWPRGAELTEAEYDAGVERAANLQVK
jgi:hypothetical protein